VPGFELSGWAEFKEGLNRNLERLEREVHGLREEIGDLKQQVAGLQVKAGLVGAIAGALLAGLVTWLVKR
jgi:hypothetical protein